MKNLIKNIELNPTVADNHLRLIEEYIKNNGNSLVVEQLYEGALSECGLHPSEGPIIWSDYRSYLNKLDNLCSESRVKRIRHLFFRQMSLPLSGLPDLFDEYRLWEEELFEKSVDSFNMAEEHFMKGQQEWNLRKPYEMKIHTDNVSNIQELFDAWMLYINFEKDKMISIEYSSNIDHNIDSNSYSTIFTCKKECSLIEYKYDPKDSVIMAYRRALDDLGSLRIDLWFEFANFISTTYNCPHLLMNVYCSSLKHFERNPKLWILYLRTIVEAAKDRVSHYNSFDHHYTPGCKIRSSSIWYPLNEEILCLSDETDIREFYMNKILTELGIIKELFKSMKNELVEMYTVIAHSIFDLVEFKSSKPTNDDLLFDNEMKGEIVNDIVYNKSNKDSHNNLLECSDKYKSFRVKTFKVLRDVYLEGEKVIVEILKENEKIETGDHFLTQESILIFYSQWMSFESMNPDGFSTLISVIEKIVDNFESKSSVLLSLIFSVAKEKFGDCSDFRKKMEDLISKKSKRVHSEIAAEWDNALMLSTLIENFEKRKSRLISSNISSPIVSNISSSTSISKRNDSSFPYQDQVSFSNSNVNKLKYFNGSQKMNILSENGNLKDSNEGDFVCLSEIKFRRDKRRFRRNFPESDYDASSECSSESNSIKSALIQNSNNVGNKMALSFTPSSTANNVSLQNMISNASINNNLTQGSFIVSPFSPGYSTIGSQKNAIRTSDIVDTSTTGGGLSLNQKSPFSGGSLFDLELRTQCTWDGREAIEPSIAPPIPPIPTLSSISVSSSSSHSSGRKRNSRLSIQPISILEANSMERSCDESSMPPPSYTPKKSRVEKKSGVNYSFQSSEDSDLNVVQESLYNSKIKREQRDYESGNKEEKDIVSSNLEIEGNRTLFLRFPLDLEMSEDLILTKYFEKYSKNIKEIRIVKNINGKNKGFAYIDLESDNEASDIIKDSDFIELLLADKISVSLSDPPKRFATNGSSSVTKESNSKNDRYKFRRRKKGQIEERKNSLNSTILVKNIDKSLDENSVVNHFQNCLDLKVKNISLPKDDKGNSRGFAFIEFFHPHDALTAHMLNESRLGKNSITINSSTRPLTIPKNSKIHESKDSINARLTPRIKSKQKLPLNRQCSIKFGQDDAEQGKNIDNKNCPFLTNEDFRKMFSLV
ncbi:protein with 2x rrm domains [Cryptosporidium ryanae]|uniref:protein with 2x rrm domains n=1 Tax=Cryptosporidium ryanae TaxID=515981 RepID=UPI003519F1FC|nr:protein with 2x rrm domains [Cryptosporidium ryanae]